MTSTEPPATEPPATEPRKRLGIVFVHGVGQARESDTLIDFAGALLAWLQRFYGDEAGRRLSVTRGQLSFDPYDTGSARSEVSNATFELPNGDTWVCAEAWWASSARPLPFTAMVSWSFRYLWGLVWNLFESRVRRIFELGHQPWYLSVLEIAYCLFLIVGYLAVGILGYLLLVPIFVAAQIPYPPIQNFFSAVMLQPILQYNASELRTFVEDDIQAANMRRKIANAIDWLTRPLDEDGGGCDVVSVVVHSGGCWVAFEALSDPAYQEQVAHVRRLITFGNGLNKIWEIAPDLLRLQRPIRGNIYWLDLWSGYDPVPVQWMDPPREQKDARPAIGKLRVLPDRRKRWISIYEPSDTIKKWLEPRTTPRPPSNGGRRDEPTTTAEAGQYWPESRQVTNRMDVLTDHGAYLTNDEEVLRRMAAEIDTSGQAEPDYRRSQFWGRQDVLDRAQRARRVRVAWLAAFRAAAVVIGFVCIVAWWFPLAGFLASVEPLKSIGATIDDLANMASGWRLIGPAVRVVAAWLESIIGFAAGAAVASLPALAVFEGVRAIWEALDLRARGRATGCNR